ncbi:MAG: hypothetical protein OEX76_02230 [Candidatus Bathyarchaeota archaeon]|nr:hypothetical protein [Candidatus Bathyarchaeota archaeon]MDH5532611.1 hypothetical protein [Candidatus Bathyarchaeota archaeon]MDH5713210.1 hypothetical protein [Candidatus Bathyarchaeota archaeon]
MYRRIKPKLFNITTRSLKVKVKIVKPKAPSKPKKEKRKSLRAKCLHLRSDKTCAMMTKEGLNGNLSDFDIKHFCKGNPILCYYFRMPHPKKK